MSKAWVLCTLVTCAVAVPVIAGETDLARGADAPAAKGKGPDDQGKGKDHGLRDDHGKGPKDVPTTAAPETTAAPAAPVVPPPAAAPSVTPSTSAAPTVAFDTPATAPAIGRSVGVAAADGEVLVRTADGRPLHALDAAAAVPTGARVDARAGTVELTTAVDVDGTAQTASFSGAIFEVRQDAATGLTRIRLRGGDFSGCRGVRRAASTKQRKPIRSLWGKDDHGRFQTRGKGAVGTVRGTRWLTEDFCDGTRTTVAEGAVAVRDLRTGKTHVVRAGHSFFARY